MPRGKAHPPELRTRAEGLLLAGRSQADVCVITGLDSGVISRWAARMGDRLQHVAAKREESDTDLILAYFRAALRAMAVQAQVLGDPEYCRKHDPDKLAIAHGILGDKLTGIASTAQALGLFEQAIPSAPELLAGEPE